MAMVQCENRHFYDNRKHTFCPHCPVPGLKTPGIGKTQAASLNQSPSLPAETIGSTEPAFPRHAAAERPRPGGSPNRGSANQGNMTVGIFQRQAEGVNPVTGWIVCVKGVNTGRDYRLHSDRNMIGRSPHMDVCIEGDETISREDHCQIAFSPRTKQFTLIPGTGRNLIYLNDKDVFEATQLNAYDKIELGESTFLFIPFCGDRFMWQVGSERRRHDTEPPVDPEPPGPRRRPPGTIVG
jgi:FHA domain